MSDPSEKLGDKRPLEAPTSPAEKRAKLDEPVKPADGVPVPDASIFGDYPDFNAGDDAAAAAAAAPADNEELSNLQLSPNSLAKVSDTMNASPAPAAAAPAVTESPAAGIPYPPGYDPAAAHYLADPMQAVVQPSPVRRRAQRFLDPEFPDPDEKWSQGATERMVRMFVDFGKRHVLDEKMHNALMMCLDHGGNPAVTLTSPDGMNFFTYLTVASECGDLELVKTFLTNYKDEFSQYDFKISLRAALQNRHQEIAEYILRNTDVSPDEETVMEMLDVQMNDEYKRKVLPLRAFLEECIQGDEERFPSSAFFVSEVLNRAIYAHNVSALELLFEKEKERFLPLLETATEESRVIRAGRAKAQDIGEGVPPLTYAAVMERTECLEVFLKNGANPNFICNDMGGTLLHIAGWKGNTEMIEVLLSHGADPRLLNDSNTTVISRTKGRKARKLVTDAVASRNLAEGIIVEPPAPKKMAPAPMAAMPTAPLGSMPLGAVPAHLQSNPIGTPIGNPIGGMVNPDAFVMNTGQAPVDPMNFDASNMISNDAQATGGDMEMAQPLPFDGGAEDPLAAPPTDEPTPAGEPAQPVDLMDVVSGSDMSGQPGPV